MKKIFNLVIVIGLAIILIGALTYGVITWKNPSLARSINFAFQDIFYSGTPNWKTYSCPDGALSLESPFPINWTTKDHITNGKGFLNTFGMSQLNRSGFILSVISRLYTDPSLSKDEKEAFGDKPSENDPKKQWNKQVITCSGIPATLVNESWNSDGCSSHFTNLFIAKENRTWLINATDFQSNSDGSFNEWTKRIFDSIKIESKNK